MSTVVQATGRRKTATAKVFLSPGSGKTTINGKPLETYFPLPFDQHCVTTPLRITERQTQYDINIQVIGGGTTGQKEAARHGISRALAVVDSELKPLLKKGKLLRRDPRKVERKKYGLYKARKDSPYVKR